MRHRVCLTRLTCWEGEMFGERRLVLVHNYKGRNKIVRRSDAILNEIRIRLRVATRVETDSTKFLELGARTGAVSYGDVGSIQDGRRAGAAGVQIINPYRHLMAVIGRFSRGENNATDSHA